MNIEFVYPPDSTEVIASIEANSAPSLADRVSIGDTTYRVYSVEWCIFLDKLDNKMGVLVNLIKDDVEKYRKAKEIK